MKVENLQQLYVDQLKDLYNAESQLVQALPKVAKAASSKALKDAIATHLEETKGQRETLSQVFKGLDYAPGGKKCKAMEGLIEEGAEVIEELETGPVRDAALIAAAQKVEHYEIAAYGTVCEYARMLGRNEDYEALNGILDQEKTADEKLNKIAKSEVNPSAKAA